MGREGADGLINTKQFSLIGPFSEPLLLLLILLIFRLNAFVQNYILFVLMGKHSILEKLLPSRTDKREIQNLSGRRHTLLLSFASSHLYYSSIGSPTVYCRNPAGRYLTLIT